jgi:hypothetical protein
LSNPKGCSTSCPLSSDNSTRPDSRPSVSAFRYRPGRFQILEGFMFESVAGHAVSRLMCRGGSVAALALR